MSSLYTFSNHTIFQHSGSRVSNADLEVLLSIPHWEIQNGQHWAIVGGKDDQRSAIMQLIRESAFNVSIENDVIPLAEISLQEQQRRIDEELVKAKTGVADEIFAGTLVSSIISDTCKLLPASASISAKTIVNQLNELFNFEHCLNKHFRQLSSGETRRLLIIIALIQQPALLLMQDPFEGLDSETQPLVQHLLKEVITSNLEAIDRPKTLADLIQINSSIFVSSRPEQLPNSIKHLAYINGNQLLTKTITQEKPLMACLTELNHIIAPDIEILLPALPDDHPFHNSQPLDSAKPLVNMSNITIKYTDLEKPIFENLYWKIQPLQHWRVTGKNGSGKTTLLKLITGDHPQVYNNDIEVCGFSRGSGESIWDVKRYIGYMSGETLWSYRGSGQLAGKVISVVISGLYDSIGLYTAVNTADKAAAQGWLTLFDLQSVANKRFQNLSLAEQRLVLIARAMIKRPALLILDEPLQGLDSDDRLRVLAIIEKLIAAKATTLLYVSHHEDEQVEGVVNTLAL